MGINNLQTKKTLNAMKGESHITTYLDFKTLRKKPKKLIYTQVEIKIKRYSLW